jgi:hypothetical protein
MTAVAFLPESGFSYWRWMCCTPGRGAFNNHVSSPLPAENFVTEGVAFAIRVFGGIYCLIMTELGAGFPMMSSKTLTVPLFSRYLAVKDSAFDKAGKSRQQNSTNKKQ